MSHVSTAHRIDRVFVARTARFSLAYLEHLDNHVAAELTRVAPDLRRHDRKVLAELIRGELHAASGASVNAAQWRDALTALDHHH